MLILFDNNVPRGLATALHAHTVVEARARGWHLLKNGELLQAAEDAAFECMVTSDKRIKYQQNLAGRKIALVVLSQGRWRLVRQKAGSDCHRGGSRHTRQLHRSGIANGLNASRVRCSRKAQ